MPIRKQLYHQYSKPQEMQFRIRSFVFGYIEDYEEYNPLIDLTGLGGIHFSKKSRRGYVST